MPWTMKYAKLAVFHLPRFKSDHMPVLLRTNPKAHRVAKVLKSENWWLLHDDFKDVCNSEAQNSSWSWVQMTRNFKKEAMAWVKKKNTPQQMLKQIESQMETLNAAPPDEDCQAEQQDLQSQHERCILMQEFFWHQRSRISWATLGDRNSKFFQASAVTRKMRNMVRALRDANENWVTNEKGMRNLFITHFKSIYTKRANCPIAQLAPQQLLDTLPTLPNYMYEHLSREPSQQEISYTLSCLGPHKAPGQMG